jgi:hypothetical protein
MKRNCTDISIVRDTGLISMKADEAAVIPSARTLRGLDWLNFVLIDVPTGIVPFLAVYLAGYGWNVQSVGIALTVGGIAGILCQTPMGLLIDRLSSKA